MLYTPWHTLRTFAVYFLFRKSTYTSDVFQVAEQVAWSSLFPVRDTCQPPSKSYSSLSSSVYDPFYYRPYHLLISRYSGSAAKPSLLLDYNVKKQDEQV
jgi:hypothetical protein